MPAERITMRHAREIIRLKSSSVSTHEIARRLGMARSTVRETLNRMDGAGLSWPLSEDMNDEALEAALYASRRRKRGHRRIEEPDWAGVHRELKRKHATLFAAACEARDLDRAGSEARALHCGDGGLLRRPSSWPRVRRSRDVRLMSPEYVRPYVKAQKNDDRDAEGVAEAATRPTMRFVELKSQERLDMQTLHRSRDRLVGERTALIDQLRAILLERGIVAPQGKRKLEQFLVGLMDEQGDSGLSPRMIMLVTDARAQWAELDRRIAAFDVEFVRWTKENADACRLATIPGVGATIASALIAAVGKAKTFERGRDLAAWLGLVPRQFTTGGKTKLLGISKRGNKYLRTLLIHGARAALPYVAERDTPLGRWAKGLLGRAHRNIAVVAFANKLARIAWAVLRRGEPFAAMGLSAVA
jgi:transposase